MLARRRLDGVICLVAVFLLVFLRCVCVLGTGAMMTVWAPRK